MSRVATEGSWFEDGTVDMRDDVHRLANRIAALLDGRTVACAESCTAGRVASAFGASEGSSEWFRGGVVAYRPEVKRAVLGVLAPSVYTADAAAEMANGVAALLHADVAVATTGVLGPDEVDGHPSGTLFVATRVDGRTATEQCRLRDAEVDERADLATRCALEAVLAVLEHRAASDLGRT